MVRKVDTAVVKLWGDTVGAVSWLEDKAYSIFEYAPAFLQKGLDISPVHMSIDDAVNGDGRFSFPALNKDTYLGFPGLLADALPDKFGNSIMGATAAASARWKDFVTPASVAWGRSNSLLQSSTSMTSQWPLKCQSWLDWLRK